MERKKDQNLWKFADILNGWAQGQTTIEKLDPHKTSQILLTTSQYHFFIAWIGGWKNNGLDQRSYQRCLNKRICKTEVNFWAVLGSWGYREKNLPTATSMQLFGVVFSVFWSQKIILSTEKLHNIKFKEILKFL